MSGHSKWAQIKRQKAITDKKKGQVFSKFSRSIALAAKDGPDPDSNYKLRLEILRAKDVGMSMDAIDRAIKRGSGQDQQGTIEEIYYEGYGPGGVAFLVQSATDNRNRTSSLLRHIFSKNGGNLGTPGSVNYLFSKKGQILLSRAENKNLDDLSLQAIDGGAEDVKESDEGLEIYTAPLDLEKIKETIAKNGAKILSYEILMLPQTSVDVPNDARSQIENLISEIEEQEDVIAVNTNANL